MEEPANKACWMGVCVLDIVKNLNFQSCYGMGKGTWAIDQVGQNHASAYSWSHHDPNFNSAPKVVQISSYSGLPVRGGRHHQHPSRLPEKYRHLHQKQHSLLRAAHQTRLRGHIRFRWPHQLKRCDRYSLILLPLLKTNNHVFWRPPFL